MKLLYFWLATVLVWNDNLWITSDSDYFILYIRERFRHLMRMMIDQKKMMRNQLSLYSVREIWHKKRSITTLKIKEQLVRYFVVTFIFVPCVLSFWGCLSLQTHFSTPYVSTSPFCLCDHRERTTFSMMWHREFFIKSGNNIVMKIVCFIPFFQQWKPRAASAVQISL